MVWVLIIGFIAVMLVLAARMVSADIALQRQRLIDEWQATANELGLQYVGGGNPRKQGMLTGTVAGHLVRVEADIVESLPVLNFSVQLSQAEGPPFSLTRKSNPISARLRDSPLRELANPVRRSERTFDQAVVMAAADETAANAFLTPQRRDAVAELFAATRDPKTQVTNSDIRTSVTAEDTKIIAPMVSLLVDTATALGKPQDREPPQDRR